MIHLDSNAAIALLNNRSVVVREKFRETRKTGQDIAMSLIVYHELMFGAAASRRREENEAKIALFIASSSITFFVLDQADMCEAADIRAHLRRLGTPIGPYDLLIAAQARRRSAALVTANGREFRRVPGLVVIDWSV